MSAESNLVVPATIGWDIDPVSDHAIVEINQTFTSSYEERRQRVIRLFRQMPSVVEVIDKFKEGKSYQAVVPSEVLKSLNAGTATWDQMTEGFFGAIIRNSESGQIICHVRLKEVSPELLSSINGLAIQRIVAEIVQKLEIIDEKISSVLEGQHNDRLAIVESGLHLYQQAIAALEPTNRRELLMSAIDNLNEGRQRLIVSLEADIRFIDDVPRSFWQMVLHSPFGDVSDDVERKAGTVQEVFQAILRASYGLALAYEALNEPRSLQASLQPLREMILKVGTKGGEIARWLPYDVSAPPEELWHSSLLRLADGIAHTSRELARADSKSIEVIFSAEEIRGRDSV